MKEIKITTPFITLGQLLKITSAVSSGGEVKYYLQEFKVFVNNELENRRGRKLYPNDRIKIANEVYEIK